MKGNHTKPKRHLWISRSPLEKKHQLTKASTVQKEKEWNANTNSRQVPPVRVRCSHSWWHSLQIKSFTWWERNYIYMYKKHQAVWKKTVIGLRITKKNTHLNHHIIFKFIQKVLSATSEENQWSKWLEFTIGKALHFKDKIHKTTEL